MVTAVTGYRDIIESSDSGHDAEISEATGASLYPDGEPTSRVLDLRRKAAPPITTRQKFVLLACSCSNCFINLGISSLPLLLPPEIIRRRIPYEYCGMLFAVFSISIAVFEPLQAKIIPFVGTKTAFCCSLCLVGICYIGLAMLDFVSTTNTFVWPAFVIRFIEGFFYSALVTTSNVIVCLEFPGRASFAFGILEGFSGAGFIMGPLIGGALYTAAGFYAPFLFMGSTLLATATLGCVVLHQITGLRLQPKPREIKQLMRDPVYVGVTFLIFAVGLVWGIMDSTVQPYLATFNKGRTVEGIVLAIMSLGHAVGSPFWGLVFRKVRMDHRWVLLGLAVVGLFWMFMGPIPALSFLKKERLWPDALILFLTNFTVSFTLVFSYDIIVKRAIFCGLEENVATFALIVATFFTTLYIGSTIGPVIGGYVYAKLGGFPVVAIVASSLAYCLATVGALMMIINWKALAHQIRKKLHACFPSWIADPSTTRPPTECSPLFASSQMDSTESIIQRPFSTGSLDRRLLEGGSTETYGAI